MNRYLVLIGDVERSRSMEAAARKDLQDKLQTLFDEISKTGDGLVSPYTITLGDEFQAVYNSSENLFRHIWHVTAELYPVNVRWSAAIGEITTPLNRKQSIGMDGPAFYRARDGIEILKKENTFIHLTTNDPHFDNMVNNAFRFLTAQIRSWNLNRIKILYNLYAGLEVKKIARELNISEVAVYKNINAGSLNAIQGFTGSLSVILNEKTV
jgi:hypothetical protein